MYARLTFTNDLSAFAGADQIILRDDLVPNFWEMAAVRRVIRACGSQCGHPYFYVNDCEVEGGEEWVKPSPRELARSWKAKS